MQDHVERSVGGGGEGGDIIRIAFGLRAGAVYAGQRGAEADVVSVRQGR